MPLNTKRTATESAMGLTYTADYPILCWTAVGDVEHEQGMRVTRKSFQAIEATGRDGWHIMANLTRSAENRSGDELRGIAMLVGEHLGLLSGRLASVVSGPLLHGTSRMFAAYTEQYGVEVRLFGTVEEAREWLLQDGASGSNGS